jgi:hypothetical protein
MCKCIGSSLLLLLLLLCLMHCPLLAVYYLGVQN